ncbi:MAG TPA: CDP-alcohol phosphatidyltransferase family protein [Chthoniobacteraceae bacterium]|nr:CDP-alcohol phosphatidyltransferase family protein [Chthoniobacteraceae bacterium]
MAEIENRRPLKTRSKPWAQALAKFLAVRKVKPNHISAAGLVFALLGGACLLGAGRWAMFYIVAAACVQLRLLCNLMDGLVAVEGGLKSHYGDLFNEVPDRVADAVLLVCAGHASGDSELGWCCAALAIFTAYARVFGGSLGLKQDFRGPMAKQQRMFTLTVACVAAAVDAFAGWGVRFMTIALWIIALGSALTGALRIIRIAKGTLVKQ